MYKKGRLRDMDGKLMRAIFLLLMKTFTLVRRRSRLVRAKLNSWNKMS